MSSLLWPVGPRPPRVYWVRRVVLLVILVVIIVAIAKACSGGSASPSAGPQPSPSASTTTPRGTVAGCASGEVALVVATDQDIYQVGASPVFTATFRNVSSEPCQMTLTPANETWTVTSGSDRIWTTRGCPHSNIATVKTLKPGGKHRVSITWNGHRLGSGCSEGVAAQPGTYQLHAKLDGVKAPGTAVFHFTDSAQ